MNYRIPEMKPPILCLTLEEGSMKKFLVVGVIPLFAGFAFAQDQSQSRSIRYDENRDESHRDGGLPRDNDNNYVRTADFGRPIHSLRSAQQHAGRRGCENQQVMESVPCQAHTA